MKSASKKDFPNCPVPQTKNKRECIQEAKEIRENLTEKDIDKVLKDSFPASDPPGWY